VKYWLEKEAASRRTEFLRTTASSRLWWMSNQFLKIPRASEDYEIAAPIAASFGAL
jgi:hypothetical protein